MTLLDRLPRRRTRAAAAPTTPIHPQLAPSTAQLVANLLLTTDGTVHAGYRIGGVRWDYTGLPAKEATLDAVQDGWALTVGRGVHERVTTRPHPVAAWARRLDERTPDPLPDVHTCDQAQWSLRERLDGVCGCETWNRHLTRMQTRVATAGMDDKVDFRYFTVGAIAPGYDLRGDVLAFRATGRRPPAAVREVLDAERALADALTVPGWGAARMSEREQAWLRHRSLAVGIPAPDLPDGHTVGDVDAFAASVRWHETPLDWTVKVTALRDGRLIERHVQVLTCSRLDDLTYPGNGLEPWMVYAERATDPYGRPFPVEWSLNGRIRSGEELRAQAEHDLRLAVNQRRGYEAFDEPPPEYTDRGITRAKAIRDEVTTGQARDAARFVGTLNAVVSGEAVHDDHGRLVRTAEEVCLERAAALQRLYRGSDLRMELTAPVGQAAWLNQVVPGEPGERRGYQRQIPLGYLAAAAPNVSTTVGDGHGPYLGYTRGAARRPVMHDPHYATEGKKGLGRGANIWVVAGSLGAGKSVVTGSLAYQEARRGIRTIIRDPSGPLLRLCSMPELAPYANGINLLESEDGTLNPPPMVREPRREEHGDEDRYRRAVALARGERSDLVQDVARRALQHDLYAHPETVGTLRDAARAVEWTASATLWDLVAALDDAGAGHPRTLAHALRDASERPLLSLLFAPAGQGGDYTRLQHGAATLTVLSTPGIKRASDATERADWTPEERAADPVIYLTGLYTGRLVYDKPMHERAVLILDEAEDLTDGSAGRAFLSRLGRDHSKWNVAAYLCLKNISDSILGPELRNYLAGSFVGRMSTLAPAEAMLDVLRIEEKAYAKGLLRLSTTVPGEWVHLDADGNVGGIRADVDYHPALRDVLFTDPTPEGSSAWGGAEVLG